MNSGLLYTVANSNIVYGSSQIMGLIKVGIASKISATINS